MGIVMQSINGLRKRLLKESGNFEDLVLFPNGIHLKSRNSIYMSSCLEVSLLLGQIFLKFYLCFKLNGILGPLYPVNVFGMLLHSL